MIVRYEDVVSVTIDKNDKEEIILRGSVLEAMELAESLGCECYATHREPVLCASIIVNGERKRIFKIKQYDTDIPKIYFSSRHLSEELRKRYAHVVTGLDTSESGQDLMYSLDDIPSNILREFFKDVIRYRSL